MWITYSCDVADRGSGAPFLVQLALAKERLFRGIDGYGGMCAGWWGMSGRAAGGRTQAHAALSKQPQILRLPPPNWKTFGAPCAQNDSRDVEKNY